MACRHQRISRLEESSRKTFAKRGAVPATIGIVNGRVKIGLEGADLVRLADKSRAAGEGPVKVSRRDIGPVLSLKKDGGTTICSTLIFAALAGIKSESCVPSLVISPTLSPKVIATGG